MVWNRDDLTAGLVFLGIGLFFAANTLGSLDVGTAASMGPGFFPLALCIILTLLGIGILVNARKHVDVTAEQVERPQLNWRAIFFVIVAPIAFGLMLRSLGLVAALAVTIGLAVAASSTIGVKRGLTIVIGMTAFCVVVFYYGLQVPVSLFNPTFFN
ncbi:tripartite tricarboxylate transporter TctB family protein [Agrobacterium salinitolerans]|uniref:tripartite tricarboxylate transporter TctB family protein n=1 Tax=Agrobacterium salinitolerans TaxID=1183413 RepID=UPI001574039E|nr:tripartite tricarboxylate transporter TctB family protein [Agrobacterium salinitolerans]NTA40202.1 tripartite tricarboxylate transporter TctB family protein [Agrobacterium salinitolerans]